MEGARCRPTSGGSAMVVGVSGGRVLEWRRYTVVAKPQHHSLIRVRQVVAVVHPDSGVCRFERDLPYLSWADVESVHPQWTSAGGCPVSGKDQHGMSVEVPGVRLQAPVDHGES